MTFRIIAYCIAVPSGNILMTGPTVPQIPVARATARMPDARPLDGALCLAVCREAKVQTTMAWIEPTAGDNFATSKEVNTFHTVCVGVAEE